MIAKFALLCCLLWSQGYAAESPLHRFSRSVEYQDNGQQQLLAVPLDSAVYANSASDFRDLRLIDQQGVETPYLLQKITDRKTVVQRLPSPSKTATLQKSGSDGIVIALDLSKEAVKADGLSVITSQRNFEFELQVLGSTDGKNWQVLLEKAVIYDYSRYMQMGNRDINLPANDFRHFKLIVAKASQTRTAELLQLTRTLKAGEEQQRTETVDLQNEPLHIERIEFWHNRTETQPETEENFDYPVTSFKISQDAEHKTSLIDIETQRQPLTGLTFKSSTPHFSRYVEAQVPLQLGIETRMQTISAATLEALHFQDINREQTTINFSEQRQQKLRLVVNNQDSPALEIESIMGKGPGYQLVFLPKPGLSYQIQYGSDQVKPPYYDNKPMKELQRQGYQYGLAKLGPEIGLAAIDSGLKFSKFLNSRVFLGLMIGLMVLVLGWSLFSVSKRF